MKLKLSDYENLLYLLLDLLVLNVATLPIFVGRTQGFAGFYGSGEFILWVFMNFSWLLIAKVRGEKIKPTQRISKRPFIGYTVTWFFSAVLSLAFISFYSGDIQSGFLTRVYLVILALGLLSRFLLVTYTSNYYRKHVHMKRIVVVGVNAFSIDFVHRTIRNPEFGYKFLGFFGDTEPGHEDVRVRKFEKIYDFLLNYGIDEVYISLPSSPDYRTKELIKFCHLNFIQVNFLNEFIHLLNKKTIQVDLNYDGPTPIVTVAKEPLEMTANKLLKRGFDLVFSTVVLVTICSWLFPIIAILIKFSSKGPVFFKQRRTGLDNRPFYCYKFRTMRVNKEADSKQATSNDSRITPIGSFLRKTSLDEFPQFINVFKGEMSVVGPRPHMLAHTRMYSKIIAPFMVRHWVKPGITGLAQAKGFRGETEEVRQMYHRVKMDVFYIQNWSFWMDLQLIFETFWGMVTAKNKGG